MKWGGGEKVINPKYQIVKRPSTIVPLIPSVKILIFTCKKTRTKANFRFCDVLNSIVYKTLTGHVRYCFKNAKANFSFLELFLQNEPNFHRSQQIITPYYLRTKDCGLKTALQKTNPLLHTKAHLFHAFHTNFN